MIIKIQQWGNNVALRIPKTLAIQLELKKGTHVHLTVEQGRMLLTPMVAQEISLESLLAKVTPANIHTDTDWGKPKGREIW